MSDDPELNVLADEDTREGVTSWGCELALAYELSRSCGALRVGPSLRVVKSSE